MTHHRSRLHGRRLARRNLLATASVSTILANDNAAGKMPLDTASTAAASNDNAATDVRLDQYYTREDIASRFYGIFREHYDPARFLMVEPSAGTGSFLKLLPPGSIGYDLDPKYPGIVTADFLKVKIGDLRPIGDDRPIAIIGNPPFGKNASLAVRFFNHAAREAKVIGFIVPRSFRKAAIENRLDHRFHLVREEEVPADAFLFRGRPYDVPAMFQIWERRPKPRSLRRRETTHPDFTFLKTADGADFAIHRVGVKAGRIHHKMTASPSSTHFIRGDVEAVMRQLDFASVVGNVAGNPSLAKSEIVALYREHIRKVTRTGRASRR